REKEADEEIVFAREKLAPEEADVLLSSAEMAGNAKRWDEARGYLQKGVQLHAQDARFYLRLATLELQAGKERHAEAVGWLKKGRAVLGEDPATAWAFADLFIDAGDLDGARELYEHLRTKGASTVVVEYLKARLDIEKRRFAEACTLLERQLPELGRS